jgi:hypothetical protein
VVGSSQAGCEGDDNGYECMDAYTIIQEHMQGGGKRNEKIHSPQEAHCEQQFHKKGVSLECTLLQQCVLFLSRATFCKQPSPSY